MPEATEIEIRPFATQTDYESMLDYFYHADDSFLQGMGVDRLKLPDRNNWLEDLLIDHEKPDREKDRFYLIWIYREKPVGHSSINKIVPNHEAHIHLHLWNPKLRRTGLGTQFMRRSIRFFWEHYHLKKIVCEPFAGNPAPRRVLEKIGFTLIRCYRTVPGFIAFEQEVSRYELEHKLV